MQLQTNLKQQRSMEEEFTSLEVVYEEEHELAWYRMNAHPRPCLTLQLVNEANSWFNKLTSLDSEKKTKLQYIIMSSNVPNVFNLGGDLSLFTSLIREGNREKLLSYDKACIEAMFRIYIGLDMDLTTIALVQGDALGGGFEGALANDVIIAEKSAKMGLPDILFNLFPGAGAYNFLARKIGALEAERMVLGGKLYSAEELFDLGVVDVLAEDGKGEQAVYDYIKKENRQKNGRRAFRKAKRLENPLTLDVLLEVAEVWADAAMNLGSKDLRMMERLVKRQTIKYDE